MTFAQLKALVAVIDSGGFTRAAAITGSSQSAVSHAIASLERELGAKLLARDHGRIHATDLGVRVAALARQILASADEIRQQAVRAESEIVAVVQVASIPNIAACILPAALQLLSARHPGIEVTVLEGGTDEIPQWLDEHLVDVAFLSAAPDLDAIEHERLGDDEHVALVPANHPLAEQDAVTLKQLAAEPFVMVNCGCEAYIADLFARAGATVRPAYYMRQTPAIATIVAQGLGVSIISGMSARNVEDGVAVRPLDPPARRQFAAFWPRRRKTPAARAVVSSVRDIVAGQAVTAAEDASSLS